MSKKITTESQPTILKIQSLIGIRQVREDLPIFYKALNSQSTGNYVQTLIGSSAFEIFEVLFLDVKLNVIAQAHWDGDIDSSAYFTRTIMQHALLCNAKSIIIAHNHPSGELMPSSNDLVATHRISQACELLEMSLIDSFIVTDNDCLSLREDGQSDLFVD
ncbi:hypothetical protein LB941_09365 [Ligilactobacillus sp. WILCCON 0076]|uniref:MPN domain-containing protein n=1 Tax=Ligilactobacillus ubinensis TaxID=2876789 RepID=A0A9X2FLG4_9LACO|nr:JAB domain-containing protein [Ligilactobacillus ubinensis]MCP0887540.1 hypothetical protein [Ligilactobacillus ubinensis]